SCRICISVCPKNVFEITTHTNKKGYNYVAAVRPEDCIACKRCEISCPDLALYIEK
ncbi:MAG: 4Fe-4S dicluster domain-containing protein, partial [Firmicutes bacterium]|nr:4Fe-4S dicluster domain-containing protein [Bacillota bacterium]